MTDSPTQAAAILFVDDEATAVKYFQRAIGAMAPVLTACSVEEGRRVLDEQAGQIAVLVSDQRMPGAYGNELLFYARERYPHIVRILTTAYSELEHTVEAVNQGQIHRYIQKPWAIAALRMELKQALELAALRSEHARLLGEKLQVGRKQVLANRIAAVHTVCASLAAPAQLQAVDTYLSAAAAVGVRVLEPDWVGLDYADLVSAEAFRASALRAGVQERLEQLERDYADAEPARAVGMLGAAFGDTRNQADGPAALFLDARVLTEFLEAPSDAALSARHGFWLACLLWLGRRGQALRMRRTDAGLEGLLVPAGAPITPAQLAAWVEQF
jgi:two-component system, probable response regulator PhcQ